MQLGGLRPTLAVHRTCMSVGTETGSSNTGKLQHTNVEDGRGHELRMQAPPLLRF